VTIWPRKHKRETPSQAFTRSKQIYRNGRSLKFCGTVHLHHWPPLSRLRTPRAGTRWLLFMWTNFLTRRYKLIHNGGMEWIAHVVNCIRSESVTVCLKIRCLVNSHQTISHQSQLTPFLVNSPYIWNKEGLFWGGAMVFSTYCGTINLSYKMCTRIKFN